jgi:hypothetical protein
MLQLADLLLTRNCRCNISNNHHHERAAEVEMDVSVLVLQLYAVAALLRRDVRPAPTVLVRHFNRIYQSQITDFLLDCAEGCC